MFKNLRSLMARLAKFVGGLSNSAPRRQIKIPVSVSLDLERNPRTSQQNSQALTVMGLTQDFNKNEIAFIVPFVRLGDYHLAGHGGEPNRLKLVLELPNGKARMTVVTKHYQMIEMHSSVQNYLIGTEIISLNEGDAKRYADFLRYGEKAVSIAEDPVLEFAPPKEKRSLLNHFSIF